MKRSRSPSSTPTPDEDGLRAFKRPKTRPRRWWHDLTDLRDARFFPDFEHVLPADPLSNLYADTVDLGGPPFHIRPAVWCALGEVRRVKQLADGFASFRVEDAWSESARPDDSRRLASSNSASENVSRGNVVALLNTECGRGRRGKAMVGGAAARTHVCPSALSFQTYEPATN